MSELDYAGTGVPMDEVINDALALNVAVSPAVDQQPEPTATIETKTYDDGTVATGTAPLPDASPVEPLAVDPLPNTVTPAITGTPDHHYLLAEIEALGESMEASLAEILRSKCGKLRALLGL